MKNGKGCYYCGELATTREHAPPKSFFPPKADLQLKTVPSCEKHNNAKSHDDQYLLAHICMNAGAGDNLPKTIFLRSIAPQLKFSDKFRKMIADGSVPDPQGGVRYRVDLRRFDSFFGSLCRALYFDRYGSPLDDSKHRISHEYFSLETEDPILILRRDMLNSSLKHFFENGEGMIRNYEADKLSEAIYQNKMVDPSETGLGSITIAHTFYGIFNVVSLLTRKAPSQY